MQAALDPSAIAVWKRVITGGASAAAVGFYLIAQLTEVLARPALPGYIPATLAGSIAPYIALTVAGVVIARRKRLILGLMPLGVHVLLGSMFPALSVTGGAIGMWTSSAVPWVPGLLLAGVPILMARIGAKAPASGLGQASGQLLGATLILSCSIALLGARSALLSVPFGDDADRYAAVVVAAIGLAVTLDGFALVVAAAVTLLLLPSLPSVVAFGPSAMDGFVGLDVATFFGIMGLAVSYPELSRRFNSSFSPRFLLVAVNLLNLTDAVLTYVGVQEGSATEANPVVRAIGLPAKVILGLGASWLVVRIRPRALLIPLAILPGVILWHAFGLLIRT